MQKTTPVTNPEAAGGVGYTFEHAVGAYWLAQLLVGAVPPILIDCSVAQIQFQAEYLGWHTDDVLVIGQKSNGDTRKLVVQVKRTFTVSSANEECRKTILDIWKDFNNTEMFTPAVDRFAIITQLGTNTPLRHFGSLLDCARVARDADDFAHRLNTRNV